MTLELGIGLELVEVLEPDVTLELTELELDFGLELTILLEEELDEVLVLELETTLELGELPSEKLETDEVFVLKELPELSCELVVVLVKVRWLLEPEAWLCEILL